MRAENKQKRKEVEGSMAESLCDWVTKSNELDKNNPEKYSIATKYKTFTKEQRKAVNALRKLQKSYLMDVCSPQAVFGIDSPRLTVGDTKRCCKKWGLTDKQFDKIVNKQQELLEMAQQALEVVAKEDSTSIIIPDTDEKGVENLALLKELKSTVSEKNEKKLLSSKRDELQKSFNEEGIDFDPSKFDLAKLGKDINAKVEQQVTEMQTANIVKVDERIQKGMLWLEQQKSEGTTLENQPQETASGGIAKDNGSVQGGLEAPKKTKGEEHEH